MFEYVLFIFYNSIQHNGDVSPERPKTTNTHSAYVELVRNLVAQGDAREGKWRGNWRMEWVASTLTPPPNVVYPALLKLMPTIRLPAVDWTDAPTDLNRLVRFRERRNLVSARVPSGSARAIIQIAFPLKKKIVVARTQLNVTLYVHCLSCQYLTSGFVTAPLLFTFYTVTAQNMQSWYVKELFNKGRNYSTESNKRSSAANFYCNDVCQKAVILISHNLRINFVTWVFYFYRCTLHFEDSLIIIHQQMHQSYIIY